MAYDMMGNYTGPDDTEYETEEQRRRRLAAEQANAVVSSTVVKTYGDGTQEETVKRTVAGPVAPDQSAAETARLTRQNAQPGYGVQDYLNYVRQNESGNNYNIGYHYQPNAQGQRPSTAYGPYGITAPAYQDIQAANPQFQGRDISTLSPQEQDQAAQTYRQVQMRQMAARGMEPTEANLRGAQYAGVGGLNQYQQQGRLAPGVDERILQQRMAGGGAPASGAAQRPLPPGIVRDQDGTLRMTAMPGQEPAAPTEAASPYALTAPSGQGLQVPGVPTTPQPVANPYISAYQQKQDDIMGLLPIAQDPNAPEFIRQRASDRAAELNANQREERMAKQQVAQMSPNEIGRALQTKSTEGSWVKAILFGILGMENSQKEEAAKLGIGRWETTTITGPDGESINVEIKRAPNGRVLEGAKMDGTPLTTKELSDMSAAGKGFKPEVSGTAYVKKDADGNVIMRGVRTTITRGDRTITKIESGGKTYDINSGWEPESISTAGAKALQGKQISLAWDPLIKAATTSADELTKAGIKYGLDLYSPGIGSDGKPIIVDRNTDKIVKPNAQGMVTLPSALPAGGTAALEEKQKVSGLQSAGVIKHIDEKLVPDADAGNTGSDIVKKQMTIFKDPAKSDALFGLYNAAQSNTGDKRWAIVRDVLGGRLDVKDTEVSKAIAELGLNSDQASALREYNALNGPLVAVTARAVGGTQISDRDRAAAEKLQVDLGTTPALGAFNIKANQQFAFDLARYKSDWASRQPISSVAELEREWRKEQARMVEQNGQVTEQRLKFIKDNSQGQPATIGLVREAYNRFPVPEYDPNAKGGEGGWKRLRQLNSILGIGQ